MGGYIRSSPELGLTFSWVGMGGMRGCGRGKNHRHKDWNLEICVQGETIGRDIFVLFVFVFVSWVR